MKTVVIWDQMGEETVSFFLVKDKDISHWHNKYINYDVVPEDFIEYVYSGDGVFLPEKIELEEVMKEIRDGANLIVCGVAP